ncbi:very short patch repair endonuclease [Pseudarthrobacter phenanthrenivorans]|uniref:very short patch repair endonuclease n=1 Tax=Pseudarthrobacter phenanthrenivorans TaxID=361575 RepID=UPI002ADDBA3E|nr:very short patch repair endonuclease [Pseudarthrobacter phenanthrenivorans]
MTPAQRSAHMARIRSKNTKPELLLRRALHADGYRYRLHDKKLPGRPDLVFASRKKVIFVNGCFWHGHNCPVGVRLPKSNTTFWAEKRRRNQERDMRQRRELTEQGWSYLDIWECEVAGDPAIFERARNYLG